MKNKLLYKKHLVDLVFVVLPFKCGVVDYRVPHEFFVMLFSSASVHFTALLIQHFFIMVSLKKVKDHYLKITVREQTFKNSKTVVAQHVLILIYLFMFVKEDKTA